ncbi:MAG: IS110 family transposase [Anaerolineae bacterium]
MYTRIIGIDLAVTARHQAVVLDPATGKFLSRPWKFRTTPQALDRLLRRARRGLAEPVHLVAVLEATGMAWYPVGAYLHDHGVTVYRVNGRKTRALRQVYAHHAGSDRIDARVLAHLYQVAAQKLVPWVPPTGDQLALQRACRAFGRWRQRKTALQNRLESYDQWAWGALAPWMPATARAWMRTHWYDPWAVQDAGVGALTTAWQTASPEQPADVAWIPRWVKRAQELTTLYGTPERVGYPALQASIQRALRLLQQCREVQAELRALIQPLYGRLYPARWLETLYGIGADSAAIYQAFIQDIQRFPTVAQFRSWTGMVPFSKQSGYAEAQGLRLTQAGPNLIKATLYLNADVARQWDVQFAALYYRQMVDYGKHHTAAVCACASHLASRIYAVLKQQRPYELRALNGQPISVAASRQLCRTKYRVPEKIRRQRRVRERRQAANQRTERRFQPQ